MDYQSALITKYAMPIWPLGLVIVLSLLQGCVEPFDAVTADFDGGVVIEAVLTNELKKHEVLLSKGHSFEEDSVTTINDATVTIIDELQNEYRFQETDDGRYVSDSEFAAQNGIGYTLAINTREGLTYKSTVEKFEGEAEIENVFAERGPNAFSEDGITIYVDGKVNTGNSQYFRYTYEEAYKIIAPKYIDLDFKLTNYDPCRPPETYNLEIIPRPEQQQICFGYNESREIVQTSTISGNENDVKKFPVRFIPSDDFILRHRYSILVKQYVQSTDAYSYYSKLNDFSSSESVFTDVQPGFLESNITATTKDERVLGYFEVASVSEKRLFFDYIDFYPNESLPKYPVNCDANIFRPQMFEQMICDGGNFPTCDKPYLFELIDNGTVAYWGEFQLTTESEGYDIFGDCLHGGIYFVVPRVCGDCTLLGSNTVPEYWVD